MNEDEKVIEEICCQYIGKFSYDELLYIEVNMNGCEEIKCSNWNWY